MLFMQNSYGHCLRALYGHCTGTVWALYGHCSILVDLANMHTTWRKLQNYQTHDHKASNVHVQSMAIVTMPNVLGLVPCVLCPVSLCPVSCVLCPVSCVFWPVSLVLCPFASCALCPVSFVLGPVSFCSVFCLRVQHQEW